MEDKVTKVLKEAEESWREYAARMVEDEAWMDEMYEKYSEKAFQYVEDEGFENVFTEPSVQAGRGGDFFYASSDGVQYEGHYDWETEQAEIGEALCDADSEEEAIENAARAYAGIIAMSLEPVDDEEEYDEDEDLDESVKPLKEAEKEEDLRELLTTLIIDQEESSGTMEIEASEDQIDIFKSVCNDNNVFCKVETLGRNKYSVYWDRDVRFLTKEDKVAAREIAEQIKDKLLSAVEYMEDIIRSSDPVFASASYYKYAANDIKKAAKLIKKFPY